MTVSSSHPRTRAARSFWGSVFVLFAAQVGLIFVLHRPTSSGPAPIPLPAPVEYWGDQERDVALHQWLSLADPTVFARGSTQSFSAESWRRRPRVSYGHEPLQRPARWWEEDPEALAANLQRESSNRARWIPPGQEKPAPRVAALDLPAAVPPPRPTIWAEGSLAGAQVVSPGPWPTNQTSSILTNTVLALVVDPAGAVVSAGVISGSGSTNADASARAFALQSRVLPPSRSTGHGDGQVDASSTAASLLFGRLVFQWFPTPTPSLSLLPQP